MWYVLTAIFALLTGFGAGWFARGRMPVRPPVKDISKYMAAVVGREEAEEQRRANRLQLARSGHRTMRTDGGPKAKVHRMRKRQAANPPVQ
jgi:hypothetical protein